MSLLVLDGNSIVNRAYYGIKILSTKDGIFTNGIYGFLNILERLKQESNPTAVAIAFDLKAPTFRHKKYDKYKGTRKGMPEELAMQMPYLKELLGYLGYKCVSLEGYEADDILGTLSKVCEEQGIDCVIATGDRDSLQLVSDKTNVRLATTKFGQSQVTVYNPEKIMETYGVTPNQLIDIKAIQGDSSDNIPGVAGIGEKGAKDLISKYGSLSYVYDNLDSLDIKPKQKEKLLVSKENAFLSYELGTICREVPIDTNIENYNIAQPDMANAAKLMTKLELFKQMEKMNIIQVKEKTVNDLKFTLEEVSNCFSLIPMLEDMGKAYFILDNDKIYFAFDDCVKVVTYTDEFLKAFGKNKAIKKYCTNAKAFYKELKRKTGEDLVSLYMDTSIVAYLLNPSYNSYNIDEVYRQMSVELADNENATASYAFSLPMLCDMLEKQLKDNKQESLFWDIELPLAIVLGDMELVGVKLDKDATTNFGETLKAEIDTLNKSIIEQVGYEFNLNSPKQLGQALFVDLALPHGKKTKTGYSTNAEVLENLRYEHPVVADILQYRTLTKLNSTYCQGLVKAMSSDGRIHSNFNQTETRTGRISSTEPNLQNIPVRTDLGKEFRKFFVAKEGCNLVDADYSQIELRVLAHVAEDKVMIDSFKNGEDIHSTTAAKVFNMPLEFVTPKMRSSAKAVNFGIVYGIGAFSLSKDIGVSRFEAQEYIDQYLLNFSGVRDYMDKVISQSKELGYAEDLFGRRRYLPELASSNFNMRAFGERVARNMPIQGAAADIIKIAMVKVFSRIKEEKLEAKLILQVHDELIVECPINETEIVAKLLQEEMQNAANLAVPMLAEANYGENWHIAKG
ncbi:MAG: DNA polymerase I [Clostridia bacterium]